MKYLWLLMLAGIASAQTVTLPSASSSKVTLTWTAPTACTSTAPCTYNPYRISGSCPATLTGTTGWIALPATASQITTATDSTVAGGNTYSYVVETEQGGANSGPSNCITLSIPNVPAAPTGLSGS